MPRKVYQSIFNYAQDFEHSRLLEAFRLVQIMKFFYFRFNVTKNDALGHKKRHVKYTQAFSTIHEILNISRLLEAFRLVQMINFLYFRFNVTKKDVQGHKNTI